MKKFKLINADINFVTKMRTMFPNCGSDSKRTSIISDMLEEFDISSKLRPELSDTKNDRILKRIIRGRI